VLNTKPSRSFNLSLLGVIAVNMLPHILEHLFVLLCFGLGSLVWRLLYEYQRIKLPNKLLRFFLVGFGLLSLYLVYGNFRSVEATSAFLIIGASLKMLDNVEYRDAMILLFVNFLVLMAAFLQYQTMSMTVFGGLVCISLTGLLFQLHKGKSFQFDFWSMIKIGAKLSAAVLPFLFLLFIVFPRVSTGILSSNENTATSGFSDNLEPGSVDRLALSDDLAFRVKFKSWEPQPSELYWRGASFSLAKGLKWESQANWQGRVLRYTESFDQNESYQITIEPDYGKWLFFLDPLGNFGFPHWRYYRNLEKNEFGDYRFKKALGQKFQYKAVAKSSFKESLDQDSLKTFLQVDEVVSEELSEFVKSLQLKYTTRESFQLGLLNHFAQNFKYELDLRGRSSKNIEEFLFKNKQGFCEHFAASFSYIMRLAGYPSRVVVGFQGGKRNPLSDYYIVTNRDAHAWSEVYDTSSGEWLRVDPTKYVAPARIRLGGQLFHTLNAEQLQNIRNANDFYLQAEGLRKFYERAKLVFDMLEERWNHFLLSYDFEAQKKLFASFGLNIKSKKSLWLLSIAISFLFYLAFRYYRFRSLQYSFSPVEKKWTAVKSMLASAGFEKKSVEGPSTYLQRIGSESEIDKTLLSNLEKMINSGLYGDVKTDKLFLSDLEESIRKLKENLKSMNKKS
jgi:transglutaminase-like putative cysteine protease